MDGLKSDLIHIFFNCFFFCRRCERVSRVPRCRLDDGVPVELSGDIRKLPIERNEVGARKFHFRDVEY